MKNRFFLLSVVLLCLLCILTFTACNETPEDPDEGANGDQTEQGGTPDGGEETPHTHAFTHHADINATCGAAGNIEYWECTACDKYFADAEGNTEITDKASVILEQLEHTLIWKYSEAAHWKEYTCEHQLSIDTTAAHTLDANNYCATCGYQKGTEGLEYTLNDDGESYAVTGIGTASGAVVIGSLHEGKPVTSIGNRAFLSCDSLESITIPANVTSIHYKAFLNCDSLESITISANVTSIGEGTFSGCDIEDVKISDY